jgi:hypothetical protein
MMQFYRDMSARPRTPPRHRSKFMVAGRRMSRF